MVDLSIDLPEHFLDEEIRCGYTITQDMKKIWAVELDLLHQLLEVCDKHQIIIYAIGGTMLGAVRHKGFIPWDDDIDMMMPRDQYEKLCEVAPLEFQYPYFFQTEYNDPGSLRGHAQLRHSETTAILRHEVGKAKFNQGIFIDIIPFDNVVDNEKLYQKQGKKALRNLKIARGISSFTNKYNPTLTQGVKGEMLKILHFLFGKGMADGKAEKYFYSRFEKSCQKYNALDTERYSALTLQFFVRAHTQWKADYAETIEMPFEFMTIPVGKNYDHALTARYGDYMKFVVGSSIHGEVIFDTEHSYRDYISGKA